MDWIIVEQIRMWAPIGVAAREREQPTGLLVDLRLALDLSRAGRSDRLSDTLDYAAVVEFVRSFGARQRCALIETLAESLCAALLAACPLVQSIDVAIYKEGLVPEVGRVGVALQRSRGGS